MIRPQKIVQWARYLLGMWLNLVWALAFIWSPEHRIRSQSLVSPDIAWKQTKSFMIKLIIRYKHCKESQKANGRHVSVQGNHCQVFSTFLSCLWLALCPHAPCGNRNGRTHFQNWPCVHTDSIDVCLQKCKCKHTPERAVIDTHKMCSLLL